MQAFCEEHLTESEKSWYEKTWKKFLKSIDNEFWKWYTNKADAHESEGKKLLENWTTKTNKELRKFFWILKKQWFNYEPWKLLKVSRADKQLDMKTERFWYNIFREFDPGSG